jgi:type I restriction enzyme S subunit
MMTKTVEEKAGKGQKGHAKMLPKNWRWVKLSEVATFINGRAYKQGELLEEGTPVLRIQNLHGGDHWYHSNLELPPEKYCDQGDLLYAWSTTFGPYMWNGPKVIFHYHIWKVLPHEDLDKGFAYYLLKSITEALKATSHGSSMLHITKGGMESWNVAIPPLDEQKRIVGILSDRLATIDKARLATQTQLEAAQALPAAYLRQIFNSPEAQKWEKKPLGAIASISTGTTPSTKRRDYYQGEIPFIKTAGVVNNRIKNTSVFVSQEAVKDFRLKIYPIGTVLMGPLSSFRPQRGQQSRRGTS